VPTDFGTEAPVLAHTPAPRFGTRRGPPAPVLMLGATFRFALTALCVKLASVDAGAGAGEIVLVRSLVGLAVMGIAFGALFGVLRFDDPLNALAMAAMLLIAGKGVAATWLSQRIAPAPRHTQPAPTET